MNKICLTIYNYLLLFIQKLFYKDMDKDEEESIISIDQEWENILKEDSYNL